MHVRTCRVLYFFSSRRRHTRSLRDWSSDVCSSDLGGAAGAAPAGVAEGGGSRVSTHSRPERVAQMVQQLLGEIFARGMRDPRIGLVTITGVKMSPALREARVYWTVH